jgi:hypothetical protein
VEDAVTAPYIRMISFAACGVTMAARCKEKHAEAIDRLYEVAGQRPKPEKASLRLRLIDEAGKGWLRFPPPPIHAHQRPRLVDDDPDVGLGVCRKRNQEPDRRAVANMEQPRAIRK